MKKSIRSKWEKQLDFNSNKHSSSIKVSSLLDIKKYFSVSLPLNIIFTTDEIVEEPPKNKHLLLQSSQDSITDDIDHHNNEQEQEQEHEHEDEDEDEGDKYPQINTNKIEEKKSGNKIILSIIFIMVLSLFLYKSCGTTTELPLEEIPVEETPVEETPVEETPVEETPVEETPVEETPVEEIPVEEIPVEEIPVEETPVEETPIRETPVNGISTKEAFITSKSEKTCNKKNVRVELNSTILNAKTIIKNFSKIFALRSTINDLLAEGSAIGDTSVFLAAAGEKIQDHMNENEEYLREYSSFFNNPETQVNCNHHDLKILINEINRKKSGSLYPLINKMILSHVKDSKVDDIDRYRKDMEEVAKSWVKTIQ